MAVTHYRKRMADILPELDFSHGINSISFNENTDVCRKSIDKKLHFQALSKIKTLHVFS